MDGFYEVGSDMTNPLAARLRNAIGAALLKRDFEGDNDYKQLMELHDAFIECVEVVIKASEDKWEVESQSTGMKYGGPTDLADTAAKAIARLEKLCSEVE